jgi:hypothetical protein
MLVIVCIIASSITNAESLEIALKNQEIKTFSPVQAEGKSIGSYEASVSIVAGEVCSAMGYLRLVSF